jgi:hypothetical protein
VTACDVLHRAGKGALGETLRLYREPRKHQLPGGYEVSDDRLGEVWRAATAPQGGGGKAEEEDATLTTARHQVTQSSAWSGADLVYRPRPETRSASAPQRGTQR